LEHEHVVYHVGRIPAPRGLNRYQLGDRYTTPCDDDALPLLDPIQKLGQVGLRLIGTYGGHD
jgi:hypothetical protein